VHNTLGLLVKSVSSDFFEIRVMQPVTLFICSAFVYHIADVCIFSPLNTRKKI